MKSISSRKWVFSIAAPAVALTLIAASCAQQSESPIAPSAVRGSDVLVGNSIDPVPTETPLPDPTPSPTVTPTPPPGIPCSPGFWKNHEDDFNAACTAAAAIPGDEFASCADLLTAITCKGSEPGCTGPRRQAAAAALNTVSGCTEDD